jgi:signal transduction histidine kinase
MASHQLRTPLTTIKGNISLILDGDAGEVNDVERKLLTQTSYSTQRMIYIIADLLNVSRLRTGKFVIDSAPVDLIKVIEEELDQLQYAAQSKSLKLEFKKPDKITPIMLDESKTRQIIMNFVDNAIYYTPTGKKITMELSENNSMIEFRVTDEGIGVPKSEQHHLFTKFYRAANARKARPDGTGLGLFMAKKVIIAQGGAVIFDSKENKGSTFGFMFSKNKLAVPEHFEKRNLKPR